ncbi:glycosyltransferase [Bombilactobacillus bombi]|uniref:glycosyltransferase n=1 Tax=Bombilactobacillus bombi TaxID=1303590 RepID=UPI0015E605DB|nr:glycosyltransferase [Bombilactobacillus bombi]MBA1435071.1 glycosyltransferase family 1 protein [Bombilactobacillus bombi]
MKILVQPVKTKIASVQEGNIHDYDSILDYFNNQMAHQDLKKQYHSITFVTTGIEAYNGGQTTMLHLGTLLAHAGYDVYYQSYVPQSRVELENNAEFNYPGYQGTCLEMSELKQHQSDIWVATLWESAYIIKNLLGYKLYFVQDYEPYFYPFGDRFQLAKKTYELGLHMISLGPWCQKMIQQNCQLYSPLEQINFPVDLDRYPHLHRNFSDYPHKKKLKLAVYTKFTSPRRAPINVELILRNCEKILKQHGYQLEISYFGTEKEETFINGKNLGKLTPPQLVNLYHHSDFGIAPSMTNFSLVPFEMMSTGLPFIDFKEGTGRYFIPQNCCFITHFDETELAHLLMQLSQDAVALQKVTTNARQHLHSITWERTFKDILNILTNLPTS